MKLSIWSSYYADLSPEAAIAELASHGFVWCELSDEQSLALMERGDPAAVGAAFGAYAREKGITVLQGHLTLKAKIGSEEDLQKLLRQLIAAFLAMRCTRTDSSLEVARVLLQRVLRTLL